MLLADRILSSQSGAYEEVLKSTDVSEKHALDFGYQQETSTNVLPDSSSILLDLFFNPDYGDVSMLSRNIGKLKVYNCPCDQLHKHYTTKTYWGVDIYIRVLLTSALVGGECKLDAPAVLHPRKEPRYPSVRKQGRPRNQW
jgi:hypothetical protein